MKILSQLGVAECTESPRLSCIHSKAYSYASGLRPALLIQLSLKQIQHPFGSRHDSCLHCYIKNPEIKAFLQTSVGGPLQPLAPLRPLGILGPLHFPGLQQCPIPTTVMSAIHPLFLFVKNKHSPTTQAQNSVLPWPDMDLATSFQM